MAISPLGSTGASATAYQAVQAAQAAQRATPPTSEVVRPAPSVGSAPEASRPERADRVTLSAGARSLSAYEALRTTSRVIQNDTVAAAQDRSGQAASRLHVIA